MHRAAATQPFLLCFEPWLQKRLDKYVKGRLLHASMVVLRSHLTGQVYKTMIQLNEHKFFTAS